MVSHRFLFRGLKYKASSGRTSHQVVVILVILVILGKTEHKNPHSLTNQILWFEGF